MSKNQNIDSNIRDKLEKLYGRSPEQSLNRLIKKWTSQGFGLEIMGSGFNYQREKVENDISWIEISEILEQIIVSYCDDAKYYLLFDELDEDYKDFRSEVEKERYLCMVTSLFKAVQQVKTGFESEGKNIFPVVFFEK